MNLVKQYRRSALKLIARARMRGKYAEPVLRSVASIAAVAAAGAVVWALLGFARVGFAEIEQPPARTVIPASESSPGTNESTPDARGGTLARRECLVYINEGDAAHYHSSVHSANDSARKAMSIDLARSRGLEACQTCFKGRGDGAGSTAAMASSKANR